VVSDEFPQNADILDRHDLIVLLKDASSNLLIVEHAAGGWELRFTGSSLMGIVESGEENQWKGCVHIQYGGKKAL
jgi:hypothetical protein